MSKKRTSAELKNDGQKNQGSDSVLHLKDKPKRAKLNPLNDTTLQNLSIQLLQRVLVEAVVMEVIGLKLAKYVWKAKASLVINRLKDVSLLWSRILMKQEFLSEVHKVLDGTAEDLVHLEILQESLFNFEIFKVVTLKDEIFMLCGQEVPEDEDEEEEPEEEGDEQTIKVYDRNNMAAVKYVVELPEAYAHVTDIETCHVSNCVYALCANMEWTCPSVVRITKDATTQRFDIISPYVAGLRLPMDLCAISVLPNGIVSVTHGQDPNAVDLYDPRGSAVMSADIHGFRYVDRVLQKANGNLVLASINGVYLQRFLTEIDTKGKVQRQYGSSLLRDGSTVSFADAHGRIVITRPVVGMELLDSELNVLDFAGGKSIPTMYLHAECYNRERNEIMSSCVFDTGRSLVTIYRFTEEASSVGRVTFQQVALV